MSDQNALKDKLETSTNTPEVIHETLGWAHDVADLMTTVSQSHGLGEPMAVLFVFPEATAQLNREDLTADGRDEVARELREKALENMVDADKLRAAEEA